MEVTIAASKNKKKDCFSFFIDVDENCKHFVAKSDLTGREEVELFEENKESTTVNISNKAAQSLLEDLWEAGLRPRGISLVRSAEAERIIEDLWKAIIEPKQLTQTQKKE